MVKCSVKGCKHRSDRKITRDEKVRLCSFSKNKELIAKWVEACGQYVDTSKKGLCVVIILYFYCQ